MLSHSGAKQWMSWEHDTILYTQLDFTVFHESAIIMNQCMFLSCFRIVPEIKDVVHYYRKEFMEKDLFGSVLIIRQFCSWAGDGVFSPYLITLLVGFVQHHWLMISGQKYKSISLQNAWLTRNKYHQQLRVNDNIKAILEIEASVSETAQLWILVALGQTRQDGSCLRASGQIW